MHQQHRIATALAGAFALAFSTAALSAEVKYDPGDNVKFTYCYAHPPAARIKSGDTVITSTRDASNDVFAPTDKTLMSKLDLTKVNPQTGPFYVEGAEPGDTLQVHLDKIELNRDFGWGGARSARSKCRCVRSSAPSAPRPPAKSASARWFPARTARTWTSTRWWKA
jgi:hypothetical protein